jgi:hypothetical protein
MPPDPDSKLDTPAPDPDWADSPLTAQTLRFEMRGKRYYAVQVKTATHDVKVYVSPQGRSVRVYLDGIPMSEEPPELTDRLKGLY